MTIGHSRTSAKRCFFWLGLLLHEGYKHTNSSNLESLGRSRPLIRSAACRSQKRKVISIMSNGGHSEDTYAARLASTVSQVSRVEHPENPRAVAQHVPIDSWEILLCCKQKGKNREKREKREKKKKKKNTRGSVPSGWGSPRAVIGRSFDDLLAFRISRFPDFHIRSVSLSLPTSLLITKVFVLGRPSA